MGSLVMHVRKCGGGRPPVAVRRLHGGAWSCYCPACPPWQILVKLRMLSGYVLKIGSPKWFFGELKQWKYFVLYVDHRGPMNSGTSGNCWSQSCSSFVAMPCCFFGSSVVFHCD